MLAIQNKERIVKVARGKDQEDSPVRVTPDFSVESLKARRCSTDSKRPQMPAQTVIPSKIFNCNKWEKQDIPR